MLQRLMLNLLLIFSFGFGQLSALTHEFSHYNDTATSNQQQSFGQVSQSQSSQDKPNHKPTSHNQVCEKCVTYAELGHVISSSHVAFTVSATTHLLINSRLETTSLTAHQSYSARAPPTLA